MEPVVTLSAELADEYTAEVALLSRQLTPKATYEDPVGPLSLNLMLSLPPASSRLHLTVATTLYVLFAPQATTSPVGTAGGVTVSSDVSLSELVEVPDDIVTHPRVTSVPATAEIAKT